MSFLLRSFLYFVSFETRLLNFLCFKLDIFWLEAKTWLSFDERKLFLLFFANMQKKSRLRLLILIFLFFKCHQFTFLRQYQKLQNNMRQGTLTIILKREGSIFGFTCCLLHDLLTRNQLHLSLSSLPLNVSFLKLQHNWFLSIKTYLAVRSFMSELESSQLSLVQMSDCCHLSEWTRRGQVKK